MFRKYIAMDLGTANTLIFVQSEDFIRVNEPSVVALDKSGRILAVGKKAKECIGRTPQNITTIRPLKDGVIADFEMATVLISKLLQQVMNGWGRPHIIIGVPTGITDVERKAVVEAAMQAGARNVKLISEPMAAAIGAGLPVLDPIGSMVIDLGGGTTDIAIITLGGMANCKSIRTAGDALTASVQRHLQEKMHLVVGENIAEMIKIKLGTVSPMDQPLSLEVSGKDVSSANPRTVCLCDDDIRDAISPIVDEIITAVLNTLEKVPPELGADLLQRGILLTGGTALLHGLDQTISKATGLPVHLDSDPLTTVLRGVGITLNDIDKYKDVLTDYS